MKSYEGKTALVTGGSSGIGLALACQLASLGAHVWILARDSSKLQEAASQIETSRRNPAQQIQIVQADVTDFEQLQAQLEEQIQTDGTPDYLFNSAGVAHPGLFEQLDLHIFRWMMEVNYFGTVNVTKALLPGMIQRASGHIINISSIAGFLGVYGYSAYGPTKFAIRGLSDVLRTELAPHGLHVSVVFPPDTQTPQLDYENQYKPDVTRILDESNKVMAPEAVAKVILRDTAKNRYIITPGFDSTLYYYANSLLGNLPYRLMDWMVANARRKLSAAKSNGTHKNKGNPDQV